MSRSRVIALVSLALACVSPLGERSDAAPESPAPPPPAAASAAPALPLPEVAAVRARLAERQTGLARHELPALARTIVREARHHELPVELVMAVMHVESRYRNFAVSPVGAMGLMQVLPATGEELAGELGIPWRGARTLFDPHANVALGVAYLKWLEQRYGRLEVALAAYNWGPGRIDRRLRNGRPVPAEYARSVLAVYGERRSHS